jgi:ribosomal protein L24E
MFGLAHLRGLRSQFARLACVATLLGAMTFGVAGHQTVADAAVPLHCPSGDYRTPADKLPRPGVVVVHRYTYLPPDYSTYTINNAGKLTPIYISSLDFETKIVSVWENGTNCYGSEISRNAWAVTPNGQVYGDSTFSGPPAGNYGGRAGLPLKKPIVGMSPTATGLGYWLVASDGGIFTFGDARFYGSTGAKTLRAPIVGMTATPSGKGYWLVASDGGIFTFGDAKFRGSLGAQNLAAPIAGMIPHGTGYTLIGEDGQIYPFP